MSPMKERTKMSGETKREPRRKQTPRQDEGSRRRDTEARARKLAERHRETLDYLSKS
jgi:hypothetical protein